MIKVCSLLALKLYIYIYNDTALLIDAGVSSG